MNAGLALIGAGFCQICRNVRAKGSENLRAIAKCKESRRF